MSIKIALAGNPNCGKTTLFNNLTGSNQYVGNWPGVTVEKKEGCLLYTSFVELPLVQPGDKAAPHTGVGFLERDACAPAVKAAADLHSRGTGSPDCEAPALFAVVTLPGVRAEDAVGVEAVAVEEGFGDGGKIHTKDSFYRNFYRERILWNR